MVIEKFPYIFKKFVKSPVALVKRNQISTWAMWKSDFRMGRGRVGKSSKISPLENNLSSRGPTALGLIFEDFSTLGMKKFPYLKTGPIGNPILFRTK